MTDSHSRVDSGVARMAIQTRDIATVIKQEEDYRDTCYRRMWLCCGTSHNCLVAIGYAKRDGKADNETLKRLAASSLEEAHAWANKYFHSQERLRRLYDERAALQQLVSSAEPHFYTHPEAPQ